MRSFTVVRAALVTLAAVPLLLYSGAPDEFHFVILGDRTGEAQPRIFEQVWRETAVEHPAFVLSAGDSIQGLQDLTADKEWRAFQQILTPYRRIPLYLAAGNHDVWSDASEQLFRKYSGHSTHYSFDYGPAHFTVLDNSRTEQFTADEVTFLEEDLRKHAAQPLKFIVSHRPSWIFEVLLSNSNFPVQQLAKKYGVQYVISGHVHQMWHARLDGVTYLSMPSAGGHLRASMKYEDGWFFAHTLVNVSGTAASFQVNFQVKELKAPAGMARVTGLDDWGRAGLAHR